jgi:hypothetical protein
MYFNFQSKHLKLNSKLPLKYSPLADTLIIPHSILQVRNAIHALQELATTSSCVAASRYPYPLPAHSNPNLPHSQVRQNSTCTLMRSSSHPPEIFRCDEPEYLTHADAQTQTDAPIDLLRYLLK